MEDKNKLNFFTRCDTCFYVVFWKRITMREHLISKNRKCVRVCVTSQKINFKKQKVRNKELRLKNVFKK